MSAAYPPVVFKPRLRQILADRGQEPEKWLIEKLKISNITAKRILDGCDLRLGRAKKISALLDLEIDYLWNI